jgi:hypothetical protein
MDVPDHLAIGGMDRQPLLDPDFPRKTTHVERAWARAWLDMASWGKRW